MDHSESEYFENEAFQCYNKLASYSCKKCDYRTDLKIILNTHIHNKCQKTDTFNERNYMCNNCNFISHSILVSLVHERSSKCDKLETTSQKNTSNSWSCKFCEYKSSIYGGLKEHYLIQHSDKVYKCDHSFSKTTRKRDLMGGQHTDREHLAYFKCQHCPYKTIYKNSLHIHIILHHTKPEEIKWHECTQCNYKAKIKSHLTRHIEDVHTDEANKNSIQSHKKKPSGFKPYQCNLCSHQTYQKSDLKKHINSRHAKAEEIKWFYCDKCDYKTKRKSCIRPHIAAKHSKECRYNCDQCGYKTNHLRVLRDHRLAKHTDLSDIDHWYECDQCDYKAKIKTTLQKHVSIKHGGNKK